MQVCVCVCMCHRRGKKTKHYCLGSWRIGFAKSHIPNSLELAKVVAVCGFNPHRAMKFFHLQYENILYSRDYSRRTKTHSYTGSYTTEESTLRFRMIEYFVEVSDEDCCIVLAIIKRLQVSSTTLVYENVQHILLVNGTGSSSEAVHVRQLQQKCFNFTVGVNNYIVMFPRAGLVSLPACSLPARLFV